MTARTVTPRVLLGLVIAGAALWLLIDRDRLDPALLETAVRDLGPWAPLAHIALFTLATLLFVPGALFGLAGGALFGPLWGTALNLVGATLGATAALLVGRYLAADWVRRRAGPRLERLIVGVEAEGWRFVAFVRLVPLFVQPHQLRARPHAHLLETLHSCIARLHGAGHAGLHVAWLCRPRSRRRQCGRHPLRADWPRAACRYRLPRLVRRLRSEKAPQWIDVNELASRLKESSAIVVIDVRGPDEFTGPLGHIASAKNLPVGELPDRLRELAACKDMSVVLVCRADKRSANADALLRESGFSDVRVLRGGMEQWNRSGLPVEGRVPSVQP